METQTNGYGKRPLWQWVLLYVIIGAIVYGLIYYFAFSGSNSYSPVSYQSTTSYAPPTPTPSVSVNAPAVNPSPQNAPLAAPAPQNTNTAPVPVAATVTYTDSGFSPSTLTIKKGETVVFRNTASDDMRVASNPHPLHNGYPTTGGCVSSTFDSCKDIAPGAAWAFTFYIVGSWGYHNHLNPSEGGTIVVQ